MTAMFKTVLIACLIALPSAACAADSSTEAKPAATPQSAEVISAAPAAAVTVPKPAAVQPARIGYVDITRIGTESERGKALKSLLNAHRDRLKGKVESRKKSLDKFKTSIEAKIESMTPQQREAKSKEFQKKLEELQKLAQTSEQEFAALQEKETGNLYEAVEQAAAAHGKANDFTAIVIKKELLYLGNSVDARDVTDDLIKALNQTAQKK